MSNRFLKPKLLPGICLIKINIYLNGMEAFSCVEAVLAASLQKAQCLLDKSITSSSTVSLELLFHILLVVSVCPRMFIIPDVSLIILPVPGLSSFLRSHLRPRNEGDDLRTPEQSLQSPLPHALRKHTYTSMDYPL